MTSDIYDFFIIIIIIIILISENYISGRPTTLKNTFNNIANQNSFQILRFNKAAIFNFFKNLKISSLAT
jgi:hypothetical protein